MSKVANGAKMQKQQQKQVQDTGVNYAGIVKTGQQTAAVMPIVHNSEQQQKSFTQKNGFLKNNHAHVDGQQHQDEIICNRGQRVSGKFITEQTIANSVVEFVHDVLPTAHSHASPYEPIHWVKIQQIQTASFWKGTTFLIVIGLQRGYQIYMMMDNGECEELVSERKGPLKIGHLLPFVVEDTQEDRFYEHRPLFAIVEGNPLGPEAKFCCVSFLSLKLGKNIHQLSFGEPIVDIDSSTKFLLVCLAETIAVCDHSTLRERYRLQTALPPAGTSTPCFAISDCFLAFTDPTANKSVQSCGGEQATIEDHSYGGQMMNAAKSLTKTVSSFGESIGIGGQNAGKNLNARKSAGNRSGDQSATVVTVVNVNNLPSTNAQSLAPKNYIAHFSTHDAIGHLAFGNGGQLVLTGSSNATIYNIFLLHPHPGGSGLGSVQHIYTLIRGNTSAKTVSTVFSPDNRWIAISTNHGTTHLFAVCPYGGGVSWRTHGNRLVNRESRFERTAGLVDYQSQLEQHSLARTRHSSAHSQSSTNCGTSPLPFKEHPVTSNLAVCRSVTNSRLTFFPPPITITASAMIKQRPFSAENIGAWASDNTPSLMSSITGSGSKKSVPLSSNAIGGGLTASVWFADQSRRWALAFEPKFDAQTKGEKLGLMLMNADGLLTEYFMEMRPAPSSSSTPIATLSSISSDQTQNATAISNEQKSAVEKNGKNLEVSINVKVQPNMQWKLTRKRSPSAVEVVDLPLSNQNPLNRLCETVKHSKKQHFTIAKQEPQKQDNETDNWLRHIEAITYSRPHRRLWMGPQFSFGVYAPIPGHYQSADLFNPNDQPSGAVITSTKCCPVLIEKTPSFGILNGDSTLDHTAKIVCGSWSSELDIRTACSDGTYALVKEKIEDAIRCSEEEQQHPPYSPILESPPFSPSLIIADAMPSKVENHTNSTGSAMKPIVVMSTSEKRQQPRISGNQTATEELLKGQLSTRPSTASIQSFQSKSSITSSTSTSTSTSFSSATAAPIQATETKKAVVPPSVGGKGKKKLGSAMKKQQKNEKKQQQDTTTDDLMSLSGLEL